MRPWVYLLGGLSIWGAHFLGVYAIASIFALDGSAERPASLAWVLAFTLACLLANGVLASRVMAATADPEAAWRRSVGLLGIALSTLSILWQAFPAFFLA